MSEEQEAVRQRKVYKYPPTKITKACDGCGKLISAAGQNIQIALANGERRMRERQWTTEGGRCYCQKCSIKRNPDRIRKNVIGSSRGTRTALSGYRYRPAA